MRQNTSWQQDVDGKIEAISSLRAQKIDQIREVEKLKEIAEAALIRLAEEERIAQERRDAEKEQDRRRRDEDSERKKDREKEIQQHLQRVSPAIRNRDALIFFFFFCHVK